jgi:hypothetical protein
MVCSTVHLVLCWMEAVWAAVEMQQPQSHCQLMMSWSSQVKVQQEVVVLNFAVREGEGQDFAELEGVL